MAHRWFSYPPAETTTLVVVLSAIVFVLPVLHGRLASGGVMDTAYLWLWLTRHSDVVAWGYLALGLVAAIGLPRLLAYTVICVSFLGVIGFSGGALAYGRDACHLDMRTGETLGPVVLGGVVFVVGFVSIVIEEGQKKLRAKADRPGPQPAP